MKEWFRKFKSKLPTRYIRHEYAHLLGVGMVLVMLFITWATQKWGTPGEPSYQGKKLTEWQDKMMRDMEPQFINYETARMAVVHQYKAPFKTMGTAALPFLLRQIQTKDSSLEVWYRKKCHEYGWEVRFCRWEWYDRQAAGLSFAAMGKEACPITPELLGLAQKTTDPELKRFIYETLSLMGADSEAYLQSLVLALTSKTHKDRWNAVECLSRLGPQAKTVLPQLKVIAANRKVVGQPDDTDLQSAIKYLSR